MPQHIINALVINTHHEFPPIPPRQFDWIATEDGYEPGQPIGYGATEQAAIDDLLDQIEDATDDGVLPFPGLAHHGG